MNSSVTHAWRKGNFKSVFRINCSKMLMNFIIVFYQITKQETQSEMGCKLQWRKTRTKRVNVES